MKLPLVAAVALAGSGGHAFVPVSNTKISVGGLTSKGPADSSMASSAVSTRTSVVARTTAGRARYAMRRNRRELHMKSQATPVETEVSVAQS